MTEKEIQGIADEVIRRLRTGEKKRLLLLISSPLGERAADEYLRETEDGLCGAVKIRLSETGNTLLGEDGAALPEEYGVRRLAEEHKRLLIAGLTLKQLVRISEMKLEAPLVELSIEMLRQGKAVTILSEDIDAANGTPALTGTIHRWKETVRSYGAVFAAESDWKGKKRTKTEHSGESRPLNKSRIDKRVIAKQDLKHVLQGELEIREDAVMTTTARDLLHKRNIIVVRYKN